MSKRGKLKREAVVEEARQRFEQAGEVWSPIYQQMRDDLRFSDPTILEQWPEQIKRERLNNEGGPRPCLVFDQTGQYVRQVVNQARRNKPALKFIPVDDESDPELAEVLQGLARQTEYESKAEVAYITALDHSTRGGLGFFRLVTAEVPNAEVVGQQCAKIMRVVDPTSIRLDPDFVEPDGSDATYGFAEEVMTRAAFERRWPKARVVDFDTGGWFTKDHVRVVDYYRIVDDEAGKRCQLFKLSGEEVLDESEFPSEFVPIFPVLGNESWDEGKRRIAGAVRAIRDSQIAYNFERNAEIEAVSIGPKAPWLAPAEAVEGYEAQWRNANRGNIAVLPYNSIDEQGNPIAKPERIAPAGIAPGWVTLSERSKADIQSGLGMFSASVGNNPNNQSGRAVLALQDKAEIGTFHFIDNLALSISHLGRVLSQVWPRIYDQAQIVRILGEDDESKFVRIDPEQPRGYMSQRDPLTKKEVITINPGAGRYDARAVVGPAYATRQTEAATELSELVNGNPQMMAILGDVWVKMRNFPEADKVAKRLRALLPPEIKQAEEAEEKGEEQQMSPEIEATLQAAAQELQALRQQVQELQSPLLVKQLEQQGQLMKTRLQIESAERIAAMNSDVKRDMTELSGLVTLLAKQVGVPVPLQEAVQEDLQQDEKPDAMMMLANAIAGMNQPKRKRLAIQAPSGEVYQGMVEDD